ncbi:hypothetical protein CGRA01v4_11220 [Colletotrichum graminicola]|nr:hypothetical protein CGRA01v4_11220 [Colletotrichum graminicola]
MVLVLNACKVSANCYLHDTLYAAYLVHARCMYRVFFYFFFLNLYAVLPNARLAILRHQLPYQLAIRPRPQAPPHSVTAYQRPPASSAFRRLC